MDRGQRFPQIRGGGSCRTLGSGWLRSIKAAASGLGVALVKMLTLERERIFVLYQHLVRWQDGVGDMTHSWIRMAFSWSQSPVVPWAQVIDWLHFLTCLQAMPRESLPTGCLWSPCQTFLLPY